MVNVAKEAASGAPSTTPRQDPGSRQDESATRAAARGTLFSLGLRVFSFGLTQVTMRFVDPTVLGRASIQLELLLNTALFLSREGFRLSLTRSIQEQDTDLCLQQSDANENNIQKRQQQISNVAWLSVPVGILLSLVALGAHLFSCGVQKKDVSAYMSQEEMVDYQMAGILYCLASLVESLAEPLVIACLRTLDVDTRASAEGMATLAKAISTVFMLQGSFGTLFESWPVTVFGLSQLVYASLFTAIVYRRKYKSFSQPSSTTNNQNGDDISLRRPQWIPSQDKVSNPYQNENNENGINVGGGSSWMEQIRHQFDLRSLHLTLVFALQGIFKHALTEGDRIVLTAVSSGYDQGVYAMASSYGGMASRMLLQPLEENGRLLFARQKRTNVDKKYQGEFMTLYVTLVKLVLYIGLVFACVGTNYTSILLRLLLGARWGRNDNNDNNSSGEAADALSAFCVYTALMALNGMTEAFVYGVADSQIEVTRLGVAHGAVGVLFAVLAPILVSTWGTVGLVYANALCMALRSMYSISFSSLFFSSKENNNASSVLSTMGVLVRRASPHPVVLLGFVSTFVLTRYSRGLMDSIQLQDSLNKVWLIAAAQHVSIGIGCLFLVGVAAFKLEKDFGRSLKAMVRQKQD